MKFLCCFLLFFSFVYVCNAQHISVANDKENILYIGLTNPLTIAAENCPCNQLVVKTSNGKISGSNCSYMFEAEQAGRADITVYRREAGKLKRIGTSAFRVKPIPLPVFCIGPYCNTSIARVEKKVIAAQEFARGELLNFDFDAKFNIDRFNLKIISHDTCKIQKFVNKTGLISQGIKGDFSQLKEKDILIFSEIVIVGPDGLKHEVVPFCCKCLLIKNIFTLLQ